MGFFSDLKEDLSQAVSELMPEEEETVEELSAAAEEASETESDKAAESNDLMDLASMLDKLEQADNDFGSFEKSSEAEPEKDILDTVYGETADTNEDELEAEEPEADEPEAEETEAEETAVSAEQQEVDEPEMIAEIPDADETENGEVQSETEPDETKETEAQYTETTWENENKYNERTGSMMDEYVFGENETVSDEKSVITEGMTINGDIVSKGSMDVIGSIVGNIDILGKLDVSGSIQGNSKASEVYAENAKIVGEVHSLGSVKIGQSSVIIGNISATSAVIAGAIKGDIDVKGPVILDTSAIVMGNIKSKSVQINNGAVVEGLCSQCYADVNPSAFFDEFKKTAKA